MRFESVIGEERFFTVFTRDSNTFHVCVQIFGYNIIIIADQKVIVIIFVFLFHFLLGLRNLVIISWVLEFNTKSGIILLIIHDHDVGLTFHATFFPRGNSFGASVL